MKLNSFAHTLPRTVDWDSINHPPTPSGAYYFLMAEDLGVGSPASKRPMVPPDPTATRHTFATSWTPPTSRIIGRTRRLRCSPTSQPLSLTTASLTTPTPRDRTRTWTCDLSPFARKATRRNRIKSCRCGRSSRARRVTIMETVSRSWAISMASSPVVKC